MGDVGMVKQGQCLTLGLETGYNLLTVHARLDKLQGHTAFDGALLFGQIYDPVATLPQDT